MSRKSPKAEKPKKEKKPRKLRKVRTPEEKLLRRRKRREAIKNFVLDTLFYTVGSFIFSLSVNIFTAPNNIAPGGVTGIATMLNYIFGLPIGTLIWIINVPLFIAAWFRLGKKFTLKTLYATTLSSAIIDLTVKFVKPFDGSEDMILAGLFGGVLAGLGLSLIYLRDATTGGSEIVARLLERHFRHIPIGRLLICVDAMVVIASIFVYGEIRFALYATVDIFATGLIIDRFLYGADSGKMLMVVSDHSKEIADALMQELERGATILEGHGAYTGADRPVLLCAIRKQEAYRLRRIVNRVDPAAFVIVVSTDEVLGEGFKPVETE